MAQIAVLAAVPLPLPPLLPAARNGTCRVQCRAAVAQAQHNGASELTIRRAQTPAELRACGSLRAAAFSIVPPDRSEFARQVGACHSTAHTAAGWLAS